MRSEVDFDELIDEVADAAQNSYACNEYGSGASIAAGELRDAKNNLRSEIEKLRAQLAEAQAKAELYEGAIREFGAVDETGVNDAPINFELWARHQDAATAIIDLARSNLPPKEAK